MQPSDEDEPPRIPTLQPGHAPGARWAVPRGPSLRPPTMRPGHTCTPHSMTHILARRPIGHVVGAVARTLIPTGASIVPQIR